jgi:transcriptional regulator with XRE-family HTH domain
MADMVQRTELGAFLRARREATDPVSVGLRPVGRRRTPGLRREELAQLAGMSVTWYTWLEQGRDITVSRQVIDSLARELRLTAPEREHLFTLAGLAVPAEHHGPVRVDATLRRLVDTLSPNPAYVINPWWDVLACNDVYDALLGGLTCRPPAERNILWVNFTDDRMRELMLDWPAEARGLVGQLRAHLARYPKDPRGPELVAALRAASTRFAELWDGQAVERFRGARKRFRHPEAGRLDLDYVKLSAADDDQRQLLVFLPADDDSAARLAALRATAGR